MIAHIEKNLDKIGIFLADLTIPHPGNNHRPHAIRSSGLIILLLCLFLAQAFSNISTNREKILGYSTNISVSEVIRLTNNERAKSNLGNLRENSSLDKAAGLKAADMFKKDYWAHFAPDGTSPWYFFGLVGYKYTWAGENLARDFSTSSGVVSAWMASSGHKANILNSNYQEIGVAVVNGNLEGEDTTLVVQLFGRPVVLAAQGSVSKPANVSADLKVPPQVASQEDSTPKVINSDSRTSSFASLFSPLNLISGAGSAQKVTASLLFIIILLLLFDSFIIFRRRHVRIGSHSFAHASIIILLLIATILYGKGVVI